MEVKQVSKKRKIGIQKIEKKLAEKRQESNNGNLQIKIHLTKLTKILYFFGKKC